MSHRVLSIQSHVVHGYVGNKCAVFALQLHGIDVDPVNTVQFSNNTGYPTWKGEALQADKMWALFEGLVENGLTSYSHVLTGYVNNLASLETIINIVKDLKEKNPGLKYFCDPVMGDSGELYRSVPKEMVQRYKEQVFPYADVLFPNQTECEFLTDMKINCEADALAAIDKLHAMGPSTIILKSAFYGDSNEIILLASQNKGDNVERYKVSVEKIPMYFTGTGDLFSALFLAKSESVSFAEAVQQTVSIIRAVLLRSQNNPGRLKEISLIQSRDDLLNPPPLSTITKLCTN